MRHTLWSPKSDGLPPTDSNGNKRLFQNAHVSNLGHFHKIGGRLSVATGLRLKSDTRLQK